MKDNAVLKLFKERATVRRYKDEQVPKDVIETIAWAGQRAPFATQMYSVVVSQSPDKKDALRSLFGPLGAAPIFFLICSDLHKIETMVGIEGPKAEVDDLNLMYWALQDAAYVAQNMVVAAESLGLGTCYLGGAPWRTQALTELFQLPDRVFPLVGLVMGYPDEAPPPRPRLPLWAMLHWEAYRTPDADGIHDALAAMDAGLKREGYYKKYKARIESEDEQEKASVRYGWGTHIARKHKNVGAFASLRRQLAAKRINIMGEQDEGT